MIREELKTQNVKNLINQNSRKKEVLLPIARKLIQQLKENGWTINNVVIKWNDKCQEQSIESEEYYAEERIYYEDGTLYFYF